MCRKNKCSCGKWTWAGCGNHIDSALRGIAEDDRCKGWKTGKCVEATGVSKVCEGCGEAMVSSTEELLKKVFQAHYHLMPACNPLRGKIEYGTPGN